MLYDGIKLAEGSDAKNLVVETGTSFPTGPNRTPDAGELFYRTDAGNVGLWVFDGFIWQRLGTGSGELPDIVPAGTYRSVTVSTKGLVTAGTNPTTLAGYGITDAAPLGHVGAGGGAHATATTSTAGFMSAADKTKLDSVPAVVGDVTLTGSQTLTNKTISGASYTGAVDVQGSVRSNIYNVTDNVFNCSLGNFFTATVNGNATFSFTNAPVSKAYACTLQITHVSGTITWPASVIWPEGVAPTLTTGKTHLFVLVTTNGGSTFRGSAVINYQS